MSVVGQSLVAPGGFRNLRKGRSYHFLGRNDPRDIATLCFFDSDRLDVHVEVLPAAAFEQALLDERIVPVDERNDYPPWVARYADQDNDLGFAMSLQAFVDKNKDHISRWRNLLQPLFHKATDILSVSDPIKEVNKQLTGLVCKSQKKKARTHFFAYLCFGRSDHALLPNTWKNGRFNRDDSPPTNKYGRKNQRTGEFSGHHCGDTERLKCIKGYEKHKAAGRPYGEIYRQSMESQFKCTTRKIDNQLEVCQPEGRPFPSQAQFMSRVFSHFGKDEVHKLRFSAERVRRTKSEHIGSYTEKCSHILERTEADVYYVAETTRGVVAEYSTVLCIARILDTTSSLRIGIGCSLNGERSEAYSMAIFSMGIPKHVFASYFGLTFERDYWPSAGLPMTYIVDRGAGSKEELLDRVMNDCPHVELSKSYSGQSKAPIESSNPRRTTLEGAPCFVVSHLDTFDYFKREIVRTANENWTSKIDRRLTKGMIEDAVKPRPIHVWNYLAKRYRTDGVSAAFDDLVRNYLPKKTVRVDRRGVWLDILRFKSTALFQSGLCERVTGNRSYELQAYIVPMTLRQIWIEHEGRLIEAYLIPDLLGGEEDTSWTVNDLEEMAQRRRDLQAEACEDDLAHHLAASEMFSEQTGKSYYGGSVHRAKPKTRKAESMDELAQMHRVFGGRR